MDYKPNKSKTVDTAAIVEEAKAYEAQRDRASKCGISTIESVVASRGVHASSTAHICENPFGHEGNCRCWCNYQWKGKK